MIALWHVNQCRSPLRAVSNVSQHSYMPRAWCQAEMMNGAAVLLLRFFFRRLLKAIFEDLWGAI